MGNRMIRRERKKNKFKNIIKWLILITIWIMIVYVIYGVYKESKIRFVKENEIDYEVGVTNEIENNKVIIEKVNVKVPKTYLKYKVSSRLEIPKIGLDSNVLEEYTKSGLEVCLSKYWGPEPNEIGNYCIAGHNYNQENMFNHLIDLNVGDEIFLSDNKNGKVAYTIYDIYRVKPNNTEPLSQETEGKREITLITCVNYSQNRLIVKASEKVKADFKVE